MAKANPFRFSTKFADSESRLVYYGYRYYSPSVGRWINRDPTEEKYTRNLYCFCRNSTIHSVDIDGKVTLEELATAGELIDVSRMYEKLIGNLVAVDRIARVLGSGFLPLLGPLYDALKNDPIVKNPWVSKLLDARLETFSVLGVAAHLTLSGKSGGPQDSEIGTAQSFLRNAMRGDIACADLDSAMLAEQIGAAQIGKDEGAMSIFEAAITGNVPGLMSSMPAYTALEAWDTTQDVEAGF